MEALHRQIFESFGRACPTSPCGLYHSHRLVVQNGEGMPEKAPPDEGISTENGRLLAFTRLEEGWSLGFYAENEKQAQEMLQLLASIHELVLQNQKLYVVRGNAQDKISLLLNRLFSLNTPDDIAYTAIAALNLGYDHDAAATICLFTLAAQDDEGAVSEGTRILSSTSSAVSALSVHRISSVRSTATRSRYAKRCPIHPSPFNHRYVPCYLLSAPPFWICTIS